MPWSQVKPNAFLIGAATYVPFARALAQRQVGSTLSSRYCYAVFLRHMVKVVEGGALSRFPSIAELGPGDSLGTGLAAMLCGAAHYTALDAKVYRGLSRNVDILNDLVELFRRREPIPGDDEFPNIMPRLASYAFPRHILPDPIIAECLSPSRVEALRDAVVRLGAEASDHPPSSAGGEESSIRYVAPWDDPTVVRKASLDYAFSQAVMEHVRNPETTYKALSEWLRPGGVTSHTIDFKSHGYTRDWWGHWTVGSAVWRTFVEARRTFLLNRMPLARHLDAMRKAGLEVAVVERRVSSEAVPRDLLAAPFTDMCDEDRSTTAAFVIAVKPTT